jgi:hypothetical protein
MIVLLAVFRSALRNLRASGAFLGNNLTAIIVLLMMEEPRDRPSSTAAWYLLIGLLYALPMAQRLHEQIPAARLALWPLATWQKGMVHASSLVLNPMFILAVLFAALSRHRAVGLGVFMAGAIAPVLVPLRPKSLILLRSIPPFPGRLGGLIRSELREMLQTLDVVFAVIVALGGLAYRLVAEDADPLIGAVCGGLLVIVMSTLAQARAATTRLRLFPISGADILLSRDAAWLAIVLVLGCTYDLKVVITAALAALTVGHRGDVVQRRWQFASGELGPTGLLQIFAIMLAGAAAQSYGWIAVPTAFGLYAVSLRWYARREYL